MNRIEKPPVKCVVEIEGETEKAFLLRLLERNEKFESAWMGTSTKSWFPKSQLTIEFMKDELTGDQLSVATIKEWIATKKGFTKSSDLSKLTLLGPTVSALKTDRKPNTAPNNRLDEIPFYYPNE